MRSAQKRGRGPQTAAAPLLLLLLAAVAMAAGSGGAAAPATRQPGSKDGRPGAASPAPKRRQVPRPLIPRPKAPSPHRKTTPKPSESGTIEAAGNIALLPWRRRKPKPKRRRPPQPRPKRRRPPPPAPRPIKGKPPPSPFPPSPSPPPPRPPSPSPPSPFPPSPMPPPPRPPSHAPPPLINTAITLSPPPPVLALPSPPSPRPPRPPPSPGRSSIIVSSSPPPPYVRMPRINDGRYANGSEPVVLEFLASKVRSTYHFYTEYRVSTVYCADAFAGKSEAWLMAYPWVAYCAPYPARSPGMTQDKCGKCLRMTNLDTRTKVIVRIVDMCGHSAIDADYLSAFIPLDTNLAGYYRGDLQVYLEMVAC